MFPVNSPGTVHIKLNTNENPYGPSPKVLEAIRRKPAKAAALSRPDL